jgi:hypothetical protein
MTNEALVQILTRHGGASAKQNRVEVPTASDVTLFTAFGNEPLVVEKVRSLDLEAGYVVAHTAKQERFVVLYEDIRAVRFAGTATGAGYSS